MTKKFNHKKKLNSEENSKRKVPNQIAKIKRSNTSNEWKTTVIFLILENG